MTVIHKHIFSRLVQIYFRRTIAYLCVFSIVLSNVAWAGKDVLDDTDISKPLATVRPNNYLSSGIDEVMLYDGGNVTFLNVSGDMFESPYSHQPIKKAASSGADNLKRFLAAHSFVVKGDAQNGYDISYTPKALGGGGPGDNDSHIRPILSGHSPYQGDSLGKYDTRTGEVIERISLTITPGNIDWSSTSPNYGGYNKDPLNKHDGYTGGDYSSSMSSGHYNPSHPVNKLIDGAINSQNSSASQALEVKSVLLTEGRKNNTAISRYFKFNYNSSKDIWDSEYPFSCVTYSPTHVSKMGDEIRKDMHVAFYQKLSKSFPLYSAYKKLVEKSFQSIGYLTSAILEDNLNHLVNHPVSKKEFDFSLLQDMSRLVAEYTFLELGTGSDLISRNLIGVISKNVLPHVIATGMEGLEASGKNVQYTGTGYKGGTLKLKNGTVLTLNSEGDLSYTSPKLNGLVVPLFKEGLERAQFFPQGYKPTAQDEMMGYALAEVAAKNAGMFEAGKFEGHYFTDIAKIHTLLGNSKQADKVGKEADGKFYRGKALDVARMAGLSEDIEDYLATRDMPTVSGVSLHKSETIRNLINAKKYTSIEAFKEEKEEDLGIGDEALKMVFNYRNESMDISARIGKAVKGLWCNTVGVCDAEASIGQAIGVGARLIGSGGKAVVGTSILGFAGRHLFENKGLPEDYKPVTRFIMEDVVASSIQILKTPIEDMLVKLHILETWGEKDAVKILSSPEETAKAIDLITKPYDGKKVIILNQDYYPAPKTLKAFPEARWAQSKTYKKGVGQRKRWKDKHHIYEWDSRHGNIEKYDSQGKHLGEFNPDTGAKTKEAAPSRRVEK